MSHAKIIQNVIAGGRLLFRCCKGCKGVRQGGAHSCRTRGWGVNGTSIIAGRNPASLPGPQDQGGLAMIPAVCINADLSGMGAPLTAAGEGQARQPWVPVERAQH